MDQAQSAVKMGKPESYLRFYLWEIGVLKLPQNSCSDIHLVTMTVARAFPCRACGGCGSSEPDF